MNNFPRYESYKDSGVDWLGEVPCHWKVKKLKIITSIYNGDSLNESKKTKFESDDENHLAYISSKDINLDTSKITYENGLRIPLNETKYKVAKNGSSLICIEGGSAGRKIAFTNQAVCFVNKLACVTAKNGVNSKFIFYTLKGSLFQTQFKIAMSGMIGGVAISSINNFYILTAPLSEQTAIAEFLDRKTTQIEQAIAQKEGLIELLQERRQILIHNAVTRGLNANVKMKHSGVDWIGEIPEHWEVVSNYALFEERNEAGNENLPILMVSIHTAVSSEEISDEENIRGKVRIEDKTSYKLVKPNDIAFNMMRAWQGAIGEVRTEGMVSPAYVVAKPKSEFSTRYLEFQFRTQDYIQQIDRFSKGITDFRKRLYWNEFKRLKTVLPPLAEQIQISEFIENLNIKIENAISCKQKEIEKLKEYKAVLINSAVTGKIKVSDNN